MMPAVIQTPIFIRHRRWWLLPLALWAGAVGWSLHAHLRDIVLTSVQVATQGARDMFRMVVLTRNWNASHGGVYVPVTPSIGPNPYLSHPRRDVTTTTGMALTLINPAYMTRLIGEIARIDTGAIFRLTSLNPIRPQNAPDDWERQSLTAFESGVRETTAVQPSADGDLLRYMAPLRVDAPCLQCHAEQGYKLGDIRGGISVSQRYAPIAAAIGTNASQSTLIHGNVFILVVVLGWGLLELLRRRWGELTGKMQELEATRGELLQSEKMASLGRMVAGFAHEINTPVGVAVGAISQHEETLARINTLLTQDEVNEDQLRDELEHLRLGGALALSNLKRAANLVQSFKRTSIDQSFDDLHDFFLLELINDVLFSLHHVLKRLPISIQVNCPQALQLHGLPGVLDQILTNLVMNAVVHAFDNGKRPGHILISAQTQDTWLLLGFADDGVGMPAQNVARLFEPFFTTRRGEGGSGLGLYICYNLVSTRLAGSIQCTSAPDTGCRFDIRFPMRLPHPGQKDTP